MSGIYIVGTADTKKDEILYLREILKTGTLPVFCVDLSTRSHEFDLEIPAVNIAKLHTMGADHVMNVNDRGKAVTAMAEAFAAFCKNYTSEIDGIIGVGGGGGTAMITAGMRELPYGIPKVMVSTLASGDTSPYVDTSDIIMFPSITDIAGLNSLSRIILSNAANALLGMTHAKPQKTEASKRAIGMTMFGVTTPAVTELVRILEQQTQAQKDSMVFHATGTGGRAMEKLLEEGHLEGLIDLTTTEIADEVCGGVLSAGPQRLDVVAKTKAPYVGAPGALDMVNFWAPDTVPDHFKDRHFHHHNSNVTLMRTTPDENRDIGKWIAKKLNNCDGLVRFLIPENGISALNIEGGDFWDLEANNALFDSLEQYLKTDSKRKLVRLPFHINDPKFAAVALQHYLEISKV